MVTQHTPGPWKFDRNNDGLIAFRIAGNGLILADALFKNTIEHAPQRTEAEANARLIAAAPELLEKLQELVGLICSMPGYEERDVTVEDCDAAKEAIAKAEGKL